MKENFIHVCFVIDRSGSMYGSESDVIGGFKSVVDEQRKNTNGTCAVSYYTFDDKVDEIYVGKDVNDVEYIDDKYKLGGCTALFDGVGTAIDKIGQWLNNMPEEERPEKNLIVIMTDGGENASREYCASKVKDMIKHQEEKYNWDFVYMGSDLSNANDANSLGVGTRLYSSKDNYSANYSIINDTLSSYRNCSGSIEEKRVFAKNTLNTSCLKMTMEYAEDRGLDINDLIDNKES